ncbi:MAG TPA: ISAs1 family transposase [Burkholderiaceae bacterium]
MPIEVDITTWMECFGDLPDPRVEGRTLHRLVDILFLTLCAAICGVDDEEAVEEWGEARLEWLRQFVPLENGIPSHDTISRVLAALHPAKFQACFKRWVATLCPSLAGEVVAIDGKTARGSRDAKSGLPPIHMVSAFACGHGITLGQVKTDEKSNEITAIPELIEALDLAGATVTLDAMGCQKKIAQTIVDRDADYVFGLKGNQDTLHAAVQQLFDVAEWQNYVDFSDWGHVTEDAGHGRRERRRCIALPCPAGAPFDAWAEMKSVVMVESARRTGDKTTVEKRYYVSSLPPDAKRLAQAIRSHWAIENRLHWCLDMTFGEDACRVRKDYAPENLNIVRKIAMNLLRLNRLKKSLPKKRLRACIDPAYLAQILGVAA